MSELKTIPTPDLVKLFTDITIRQDKAARAFNTREYTRLYRQMEKVWNELKARPGDHRSALMVLFEHPNAQVRLMAAHATLAIAPLEARAQIQAIYDSKIPIQSFRAGMALANLDNGIYKPT